MSLIGFKVVSGPQKITKRTAFRPATSSALQRIRYRLGETTEQDSREHGPFALFSALATARRFAERFGNHILACEYVESDEDRLWKKGKPEFVRSRWGRGHGYYATSTPAIERSCDNLPDGSVLASSVTPFLVINDDDPDDLVLVPPDDDPAPSLADGSGRVEFTAEGGFRIVRN